MPNYRRAFEPGGTFFLTLVTQGRAPIFAEEPARAMLHDALERCRALHRFILEAIVLLPDHLHVLMTLPSRDPDFSIRITNIKSSFTRRYLANGGTEQSPSASRQRQRSRGVWQRRFWEHTIRDHADLNRHLDYIHYNPVKHDYARCPHAWPYSSFHRFVTDGRYAASWCCQCSKGPIAPLDLDDIARAGGRMSDRSKTVGGYAHPTRNWGPLYSLRTPPLTSLIVYNLAMRRARLLFLAIWALALVPRSLLAVPTTAPADPKAAVVIFQGDVDDFARDSLERRFAEARAAGAKTVILKLNTYGGLVTAGLDISGFIKRQTDLHTIAFVDEKAISAGALIAFSCDEIVMDPSSVIGDCAPIIFKTDGTIDSMGATERAKAESPVLADFLDSAARNGHDPMLAEAMVAIGHPIYAWTESGTESGKAANGVVHFAHSLPTTLPSDWKEISGVSNPLNSADTLLTLHTHVAVAIGLASDTAASPEALAQARGLQLVGSFAPGNGEKFVELLGNPFSRLILIIVFMASLKIGLSAPGHGAAEAVALISLGLLVGMPLLTGYAQWWEVVLIFAGLGLIAFEVFVFPGHFVSAIGGTLMLIVGLVLSFAGSEPAGPGWLPQTQQTWDLIERGMLIVAGGFAGSFGLWIWLNRFLPSLPYFNRLILTATSGGGPAIRSNDPPARESAWPPIGSAGLATTELRPGGSVSFADGVLGDTRIVAVVSDSGYVSPGAAVIVREVHGNRIVVRPVEAAAVT